MIQMCLFMSARVKPVCKEISLAFKPQMNSNCHVRNGHALDGRIYMANFTQGGNCPTSKGSFFCVCEF